MSETASRVHHPSERGTAWAMVFKPPTFHSRLLNRFLTSDDRKRLSEVCTATDFRTLSRQPLKWTDSPELWEVVDPKRVRWLRTTSFDRISRATHVRRLQVTVPHRFRIGLTAEEVTPFPSLILLTELILDGFFNGSLIGIGRLSNLRKLTLGDEFNQSLDPLILLSDLRELTLGCRFGDRSDFGRRGRREGLRELILPLTMIQLRKLTIPSFVAQEPVLTEEVLAMLPGLTDLHLIDTT